MPGWLWRERNRAATRDVILFCWRAKAPVCFGTSIMQKRRVRRRGLPANIFLKRLRAAPNSLIDEEEALDLLGTVDDRQDAVEVTASTLA
jgi:hypothetical protein